ncbi:MAG: endonuclease/exonuclease/phosphatase family protein [Bacteroidetes bacterium]|nr:endonuclease/exonuclease/phosphatase family protein [Bacteroidota bacterium]MDA1126350.1 endonuclease/exonuclease/phosphatase family protein [Bacteroidota bacterium]
MFSFILNEVQNSNSNSLRMMTYNIRFDNPADGVHAWPNRKELVASVIRFHKADIIGVQEALEYQIQDLMELLPGYDWVGVGRNEDGGGEFSAILYRSSVVAVKAAQTFWLSESPDEPGSKSWDSSLPRIATWAHFVTSSDGRELFVLNTHFDHRGEQARLESARLLKEQVSKLANGLPVIVMGDLNATSEQPPLVLLSDTPLSDGRSLRDGFVHSIVPHHGPASTWTGFTKIEADRRIDYIFASEDLPIHYHAILTDKLEDRYPSDHLPVLVEVELKD